MWFEQKINSIQKCFHPIEFIFSLIKREISKSGMVTSFYLTTKFHVIQKCLRYCQNINRSWTIYRMNSSVIQKWGSIGIAPTANVMWATLLAMHGLMPECDNTMVRAGQMLLLHLWMQEPFVRPLQLEAFLGYQSLQFYHSIIRCLLCMFLGE